MESRGVSIIIACAESSGKMGEGVSLLTGIFDCLVVTGVVGNFLGVTLFVDLTSDVEERLLTSGVLSVGGAGADLGNTTAGFTVTSLFICFVNPWYLCRS